MDPLEGLDASVVLHATPPGPLPGGGGRVWTGRHAMWGVAPLALDPDQLPAGPPRRRLVRAATLTGVMGLAWAGTTTSAVLTRPSHDVAAATGVVVAQVAATSAGPSVDAPVSPLPAPPRRVGPEAVAPPADDRRGTERPAESSAPAAAPAEPEDGSTPRPSRRPASGAAASPDPAADRGADRAPAPSRTASPGRDAGAATDGRSGAAAQREAQQGAERAGPREVDRRAERRAERRAVRQAEKRDAARRAERRARRAAAEAWRTNAIATFEQVVLVQPGPGVTLVGFHEAAMPGAHGLALAASPDHDLGRDAVPRSDRDDPLRTMILPGRGRATGSSTAIDVAMPAGQPVHAPVTGTVLVVEPYLLYGRYPDTRLVVVPDGRPDTQLVVLHVTGARVATGDRVEAGRTVLAASATPFPFESQIDRFVTRIVGHATPHVHLELRPRPR